MKEIEICSNEEPINSHIVDMGFLFSLSTLWKSLCLLSKILVIHRHWPPEINDFTEHMYKVICFVWLLLIWSVLCCCSHDVWRPSPSPREWQRNREQNWDKRYSTPEFEFGPLSTVDSHYCVDHLLCYVMSNLKVSSW